MLKAATKGTLSLLLTILLLVACNSDDTESEKSIFGKWSVNDQGNGSCPEAIQLDDDQDHTFNMTFSSGSTVTGTYEDLKQDNNFKLQYEEEELVLKFVREKDHLIVSDADGDDPCEYDQDEGA